MQISPKLKLTFSLLLSLVLALTLTFIISTIFKNKLISQSVSSDTDQIQNTFQTLQNLDVKTLSSTLSALTQDPKILQLFLSQNRTNLQNHIQPLFSSLKQKYGITHWYFINPDGHTFLRAHNPDLFDDEITRFTFWQARDTGQLASGIELGKTAYALRVVSPYFDPQGNLIGYMELGEEIDHFLDILTQETDHEFVFVSEKKYLNPEKWASVRSVAGLENNWDDLKDHLIISSLSDSSLPLSCFSDQTISAGARGQTFFHQFTHDDHIYKCIGVPLFDASGLQPGMLLSIISLDDFLTLSFAMAQTIFIFSLAFFFLLVLIESLFSFFNSKSTHP